MNKAAKVLVIGITAAFAALLLLLPKASLGTLTSGQVFGLATFAFLAVFSEVLATSFSAGPSRQVASSISFIPMFACALVFPTVHAVSVAVVVTTTTQVLRRCRSVWINIFNIAQYSLAFSSAVCVYRIIAATSAPSTHVDFIAFVAMALSFFLLNVVFVTAFMCVRQGSNWLHMILQAIGPGGGNLLYDLLASPLAVFAALIYWKLSPGWLVLVALPLFLFRSFYIARLQLARINKDLLFVLVKAIETRDAYTSGHSLRVAALARGIAQDLGFRRRALDNLETAALLHDIGKIEALYVPVLAKPYELSSDERALIRTHALKGAEILLNLSAFSEDIIKAVRHHHEWYDGSGYPDNLRGEDIPLSARIIMACDAIDAMLSDRPYRDALPVEAVEAELRRCSGTQFDPDLVSVVLRKGTLYKVASERVTSPAAQLTLVAGSG